METQRERKQHQIDTLEYTRADLLRRVGLDDLRRTAQDYLKRFDQLTGIEKRRHIERLVHRIVVKPGNQLEIEFFGEPLVRTVKREAKSTDWKKDGSVPGRTASQIFRPANSPK